MSSSVELAKVKELKDILRATRSIRFRLAMSGEYDRFKNDILVFELKLLSQIEEIEFYIEVDKQLSEED